MKLRWWQAGLGLLLVAVVAVAQSSTAVQFIQRAVLDLTRGGTIGGATTINGDLTVNGDAGVSNNARVGGQLVVVGYAAHGDAGFNNTTHTGNSSDNGVRGQALDWHTSDAGFSYGQAKRWYVESGTTNSYWTSSATILSTPDSVLIQGGGQVNGTMAMNAGGNTVTVTSAGNITTAAARSVNLFWEVGDAGFSGVRVGGMLENTGDNIKADTKTRGTCTLDGASPSVCTATVNAGCFPTIAPQTNASDGLAKVTISSTTLTITGPNASTGVMWYHCIQ